MPAPADQDTAVVKNAAKKPQRKMPVLAAPVPDLPLAPAVVDTEAFRISRKAGSNPARATNKLAVSPVSKCPLYVGIPLSGRA